MTKVTIEGGQKWKEKDQVREILCDMIANEYQLEIIVRHKEEEKRILIAFSKGIWELWIEGYEENIEISDSCEVFLTKTREKNWPETYLESRLKYYAKELEKDWRQAPSEAIYDLLVVETQINKPESIVEINIHLPGRNGYIENDKTISSGRKDW